MMNYPFKDTFETKCDTNIFCSGTQICRLNSTIFSPFKGFFSVMEAWASEEQHLVKVRCSHGPTESCPTVQIQNILSIHFKIGSQELCVESKKRINLQYRYFSPAPMAVVVH